MSEFVSHAINMPYGIDLVFWAVFMFLAVLVVTKFPQGIGWAVSRSKCNTSCKVLPCLPNTTT